MSGGEGGRRRHVVLAGGRGGRVGARPGGDGGAETPGQELLVEQAGEERVGWHHLHRVVSSRATSSVGSDNLKQKLMVRVISWCV